MVVDLRRRARLVAVMRPVRLAGQPASSATEFSVYRRSAAPSIALGKADMKAAAKRRLRACSSQVFSITRQKPCHGIGVGDSLLDDGVARAHLVGEGLGKQHLDKGLSAVVQKRRPHWRNR